MQKKKKKKKKKKKHNKRLQMQKHTLNFKITLDVNCYVRKSRRQSFPILPLF